MPGLAKTSQFLLSTATLMIGPSAKVFELTPADHSLGLVKNVRTTTEPRFADLMQGVSNTLVYSVNTEMNVNIACEVYEYTKRNLAYAAGLDATGIAYATGAAAMGINAAVTDASSDLVVAGSGSLTGWAVGDWIVLQDGVSDLVWAAPVTAITALSRTLDFDSVAFPPPTGVTWAPATTRLFNVKPIKVGANEQTVTMGAKLVGVLPDGGEPVTMIFPKVKITKGLDLSFQSDNFSNMPFEMKPYALLPTDPYYAQVGQNKTGLLFKN